MANYEVQVNEQDVEGFAARLETFAQTLSPAEQIILEAMVRQSAGDDTQGYGWDEGLTGLAVLRKPFIARLAHQVLARRSVGKAIARHLPEGL